MRGDEKICEISCSHEPFPDITKRITDVINKNKVWPGSDLRDLLDGRVELNQYLDGETILASQQTLFDYELHQLQIACQGIAINFSIKVLMKWK